MRRVLFVCTGNVFRSLAAEYALRESLGVSSELVVASAGTDDYPHTVPPCVEDYLLARGLDVRRHRRRTLTMAMLLEPGPVIAMSTDHRVIMETRFNRHDVPLFTEACGLPGEPLRDVHEAVPDHETNRTAFEAHVRLIIDRIIGLTPKLAKRLAP